jgi:hypothetical protein
MRKRDQTAQSAFAFMAPPQPEITPTPLADKLVSLGFAPNRYILDINRALTNPDEIPAPSRLYRFPVDYCPHDDSEEGLYLRHPALANLPFIQRLQSALGRPIICRDTDSHGIWHHAIDLMTEQHWRHLLDTRHLTAPDCLSRAVELAVEWDRLQLKTARHILGQIGCPEPRNRSVCDLLGDGVNPVFRKAEKVKTGHWSFNLANRLHLSQSAPWVLIHGIELGLFVRGRDGYLRLSQKAIKARNLEANS